MFPLQDNSHFNPDQIFLLDPIICEKCDWLLVKNVI